MFYEFSLNNAFKIIWDVQFWHIFTFCVLNMSHVFPNLTCILLEIIEVDLGYLLYKCFFKHFLTHTVFRYFLGCLYAQLALNKVVVLLRFEFLIQNGFYI